MNISEKQALEHGLQLLEEQLRTVIGKDKNKSIELSLKIQELKKLINGQPKSLPTKTKNKQQNKSVVLRARPQLPENHDSIQMKLFSTFVSNDPSAQSNTLEQWDSFPKYFVTPAKQTQLRNSDGLAGATTWSYEYKQLGTGQKHNCAVRIQPATIETPDGKSISYFPGRTEELIEEILKKFVLEQNMGLHSPAQKETWVRFTIHRIAKELADRGKQRSHDEIKQALLIMNRSHITITIDGKESYQGPIIPQLFLVDREKYEEDSNNEKLSLAQLPALITLGIDQYAYRQLNYARWFSLDQSLSSYLYKRMLLRWTNASKTNPYTIGFKEIKQASALLQQESDRGNRKKLMSAIQELIDRDILESFDTPIEIKDGRKVIDVHINVYPTSSFIADQKAANKRANDNYQTRLNHGIAR